MIDDKLTFLGTGGGRYATIFQSKATGGIIYEASGEQIHIDPGPGALLRAKQYSVNLWKTGVMCLTHNHTDHMNDCRVLLELMSKGLTEKRGALLSSKSCYEIIPEYLRSMIESTHPLSAGDKIKLNTKLVVEATKTQHGDETGVGFKFRTMDYTISFVGDTGYFIGLSGEHKGSDILVINLMKPKGLGDENHLCYDGVRKLLLEVKPKSCVLTHFGLKAIKAGPQGIARDLEAETGVRTIAATDGVRLRITDLLGRTS